MMTVARHLNTASNTLMAVSRRRYIREAVIAYITLSHLGEFQ